MNKLEENWAAILSSGKLIYGIAVDVKKVTLLALVGALVLVVGTRVPIAPSTLSLDDVNFAFSIQQFDPWMHQPQPPGYPFFVAEARLINFFLRNVERTFLFISIVITWLSVVLGFVLARRLLQSSAAASITALLLIFNPTLWQSSLDSPLRPHLTLLSLAVAYFCWRMWNGEARFGLWTALVLGLGGGFRPDLLVYLFPLWCVSMWKSGNPLSIWIRGIGIMSAFTVLWIGAAAYAVGGIDRYSLLMRVYSFTAMTESASMLLPSASLAWLYQVVHLIAWNGVGMLSWVWLVPVWLFVRRPVQHPTSPFAFIAMWIFPGMFIQAVVHVAAPGHTLFSVPAFCIIGGHVVASTCEGLSDRLASKMEIGMAGIAVVLNTLVFFNALPLAISSVKFTSQAGQILQSALLEGINQTTFGDLRSANELSESSVRDLKELLQSDRPVVVVSSLGSSRYFRFLNSRIASYYVSDSDFWVVADEEDPPRASRIRGKDLLEIRRGPVVKVPIPRGGRIIWLMDPAGPFRNAVSKAVPINRKGNLFHSDLAPVLSGFRVGNFEFAVAQEPASDGS